MLSDFSLKTNKQGRKQTEGRGSHSTIGGSGMSQICPRSRVYFGDHPGDGIVVSPAPSSVERLTGVKVACKGHCLQEGIQEGKPRNKSEINKGQPHIIRVGQERQPYKQCKTTQIGRQGQGQRVRHTQKILSSVD